MAPEEPVPVALESEHATNVQKTKVRPRALDIDSPRVCMKSRHVVTTTFVTVSYVRCDVNAEVVLPRRAYSLNVRVLGGIGRSLFGLGQGQFAKCLRKAAV
jgi:hypothetical protein